MPYDIAELSHTTQRLTDVQISFDDSFMVTAGVDGVFQWRLVVEEDEPVDEAQIDEGRNVILHCR